MQHEAISKAHVSRRLSICDLDLYHLIHAERVIHKNRTAVSQVLILVHLQPMMLRRL